MAASITSLTPSRAVVGESVVIAGTGFGATQGASTITINGVAVVTATPWSDTSITVVVPVGTTSGLVVVTVGGVVQDSASDGQRWLEIRDTTILSLENVKAQNEAADSSPEDQRVVDAKDNNDLAYLIYNTIWRGVNDFRLTLTTGLAVTTADVTGATTIYFTPHKGNRIALFNGRVWEVLTSAQASLAIGTITSDKNYDVFAYNASGTLTLEALAWTNDTTRATALVKQDGIWCKTGALTRRYVGTFRTTATTTTEDSAAKRFLFNADNRVERRLRLVEADASHSYSTATWRSWNNSTANRVQWLAGLAEDPVWLRGQGDINPSADGVTGFVGFALDATNTADHAVSISTDQEARVVASGGLTPALGFHFAQLTEYASGASVTFNWGGLDGRVMA